MSSEPPAAGYRDLARFCRGISRTAGCVAGRGRHRQLAEARRGNLGHDMSYAPRPPLIPWTTSTWERWAKQVRRALVSSVFDKVVVTLTSSLAAVFIVLLDNCNKRAGATIKHTCAEDAVFAAQGTSVVAVRTEVRGTRHVHSEHVLQQNDGEKHANRSCGGLHCFGY